MYGYSSTCRLGNTLPGGLPEKTKLTECRKWSAVLNVTKLLPLRTPTTPNKRKMSTVTLHEIWRFHAGLSFLYFALMSLKAHQKNPLIDDIILKSLWKKNWIKTLTFGVKIILKPILGSYKLLEYALYLIAHRDRARKEHGDSLKDLF